MKQAHFCYSTLVGFSYTALRHLLIIVCFFQLIHEYEYDGMIIALVSGKYREQ